MKNSWVDLCTELSLTPTDYYTTDKKIFRGRTETFDTFDPGLTLEELGYTKAKMRLLENLYIHEESIEEAVRQWDIRRTKGKYGSVGFHCYNHTVKPWSKDGRRRASLHGPCLQSVTLTVLNRQTAHFDVFYRTTEIYKKYPADLLLLHEHLIPRFNLEGMEYKVTFHFANMTVNPTYFGVLLTFKDDPLKFLKLVERRDPKYFVGCAKWLMFMLGDVENYTFAQLARTGIGIKKNMPADVQADIIKYLSGKGYKLK